MFDSLALSPETIAMMSMVGLLAFFIGWALKTRHQSGKERKSIESELRKKEARLNGIVDFANDAIISIDSEQNILLFNHAAERIFEYAAEEVIGRPLDILIPKEFRNAHGKHVHDFTDSPIGGRLMGERSEIIGLRKSGKRFPAEASISKLHIDGTLIFMAILRDITLRRNTEDKLQSSLQEKEVLLTEIHHRVKNNLQVISSLLNLQSRHTDDQAALDVIKESQNRVKSIALIHELLYRSADLARVDFSRYVEELSSVLIRSYGRGNAVQVGVKTDGITLGLDAAVPCGLIINELVSNCIKHAFPLGKNGRIDIGLSKKNEGKLVLSVNDNGVGFAKNIDFLNTGTLGLRLVMNLANQLDGNVEFESDDGTSFKITFPERL